VTGSSRPVVLVVDDVTANRDLIEGLLEGRGYDVRQARDGNEALAMVRASQPDVVLLDIDMPLMDGITVCRAIKDDPATRLVPVVLITAASDRETRIRGLEAGADDFLTKPFDGTELIVRTRVLLRDRALNKRPNGSAGTRGSSAGPSVSMTRTPTGCTWVGCSTTSGRSRSATPSC